MKQSTNNHMVATTIQNDQQTILWLQQPHNDQHTIVQSTEKCMVATTT